MMIELVNMIRVNTWILFANYAHFAEYREFDFDLSNKTAHQVRLACVRACFLIFFFSFHIPQYTHARYYETLPIVPEVEAAPSLNLIRQFRQLPHQHDQWLENRIFSHSHLSPLLVLFLFLSLAASVDFSVCC